MINNEDFGAKLKMSEIGWAVVACLFAESEEELLQKSYLPMCRVRISCVWGKGLHSLGVFKHDHHHLTLLLWFQDYKLIHFKQCKVIRFMSHQLWPSLQFLMLHRNVAHLVVFYFLSHRSCSFDFLFWFYLFFYYSFYVLNLWCG